MAMLEAFCMLLLLLLSSLRSSVDATATDSKWIQATATFYGGSNAMGTLGAACGYGNLYSRGYGSSTVSLSSALFNDGKSCGACYEIKCGNDPKWCNRGSPVVLVTATGLCPSTHGTTWCDPPRQHFDLAMPAFNQIAHSGSGAIVKVLYRRAPCMREGGVRFTITGNPALNIVLVSNVGGTGNVAAVKAKSSKTGWTEIRRYLGASWQCNACFLKGQSLSFVLTTSDGRSISFIDIAPPNWRLGQTFGNQQQF